MALELPNPFTKYHFIESSDWRVNKLEKLRKEMARAGTMEVFLNFSVMAVNRNVRLRRKEDIALAVRACMDRFWGTEWEAELYEQEQTLFGPETVRIKQSGKELGQRFQKRLKEIFPHCTVPVLMTNSKNAPLYCLVFAGHNPTGAKIANDIFGKFLHMG